MRTFCTSSPFGRRQPVTTSPTGSESSATERTAAASAPTRGASSVSRSISAALVPAARASLTSASLASQIASTLRSIAQRDRLERRVLLSAARDRELAALPPAPVTRRQGSRSPWTDKIVAMHGLGQPGLGRALAGGTA